MRAYNTTAGSSTANATDPKSAKRAYMKRYQPRTARALAQMDKRYKARKARDTDRDGR